MSIANPYSCFMFTGDIFSYTVVNDILTSMIKEIELTIIPLVFFILFEQVAESQVLQCLDEAQSYMLERRWSDLVSLLLTSADLIFAKSAEKGLRNKDFNPNGS